MQLTGNTILVTGGGTGIGRGLTESLHRLGNQVVIGGRRRQPLQTVADANPGVQYLPLDQGDLADIPRFAAELTDRHPNLNVVINNAGIMRTEDLLAGGVGEAEAIVAVNLLGPIHLTAALLPSLMAQPRAAIVNVTSALAFVPKAVTPTYSATKAALHSYTQSLRFQLRDTAVQVIEIIPPRVESPMHDELVHGPDAVPLDDFVAETMTVLQTQPQVTEIVVDRAQRVRHAERDGTYDKVFGAINQGP